MTYVELALMFVAAHLTPVVGVLTGASVLDAVLTRLFSASVKYRLYPRPPSTLPNGQADPAQVNVVLKNLEASAIPGREADRILELIVQPREAEVRIEKLKAAAGPWIDTVTRNQNGLTIAFRALPAEAAVAFSFEVSREVSDLKLGWSDRSQGVGKLKPLVARFVGPLYYWKRGVIGLGWYIALFSLLVTQRSTGPLGPRLTYVDATIFLGGVALVALAWFFALPMSGKATACGYPMRPHEISNG